MWRRCRVSFEPFYCRLRLRRNPQERVLNSHESPRCDNKYSPASAHDKATGTPDAAGECAPLKMPLWAIAVLRTPPGNCLRLPPKTWFGSHLYPTTALMHSARASSRPRWRAPAKLGHALPLKRGPWEALSMSAWAPNSRDAGSSTIMTDLACPTPGPGGESGCGARCPCQLWIATAARREEANLAFAELWCTTCGL